MTPTKPRMNDDEKQVDMERVRVEVHRLKLARALHSLQWRRQRVEVLQAVQRTLVEHGVGVVA